jgi:amino acid transporter/nucleotide-binding universal stress UspA family protein
MEHNSGEVKLARTLGLGSIILLGIGALLGGGIFTLLGPAAGLAGPGLFLSMLLGAGLAFLNLQMYIALGTTFPEAGGGYLWVRKGLGNFQGFLAGWTSWFAHSAAAGLYALSFGYYAFEILKIIFKDDWGINLLAMEKYVGVAVVALLGYLNWRGAKSSMLVGNFVNGILVAILAAFIIFGAVKIFSEPTPSLANFQPFLPNSLWGIIGAAALFYIAFEGSEIQVQSGEETRDPKRNLRKGLFWSWAIVSALYILVSIVIVGASRDGGLIGETLARWKEGAIVRSAAQFMPLGLFIMLFGGLLANFGALNATVFSCSRVAFALARDKNIWSRLANIHLKHLSPHLAVIFSTLLIGLMVIFLPLLDVAALASLLFILLFLQLNLAGINIHYKWPDTVWGYKVPFFPLVPIIAVVLYSLLAFTMLQVNATAWIIVAFWILLGLINYFSYAETQSREQFETKIIYEEAVRIGPKTGKRILLPLGPHLAVEEIRNLAENAFALTSQYDGELVIVTVHEIPPALPLDPAMIDPKSLEKERTLFAQLHEWVEDYNKKTGPEVKDINFHSLILVGRDVVDVILDVVKIEDCDLLMLNWSGYVESYNVILSRKIDRILREAKCDLLVVKNPKSPRSVLIAAHPSGGNPYLERVGELAVGLMKFYKPRMTLFSVISREEVPSYLKPDAGLLLKGLGMKKRDFSLINFVSAKSIVSAILNEAKQQNTDLILMGAARPQFLQEIRLGAIPEMVAKNTQLSVMILRGHEGATEVLWKRILNKLNPVKRAGSET